MKIYFLICFIALSQLNFGAINLKLRSVENFKTNKAVNYKCRVLTIQGSTENDTLFVNLFDTLSFQKNIKDTLLGYNFASRAGVMHPHFRVYVRYSKSYDGEFYISNYKSSMSAKSEKYVPSGKKLEWFLESRVGELPYLIKLLNNKDLNLIGDTIIDGQKCERWSTVYLKQNHDLYLDKKSAFPVMLRIVHNPKQPFIMEYYYGAFTFTNQLNKALFVEVDNASNKTPAVLKVGDVFPTLSLQDLSGNSVEITKSSKFKIVYFSMINCAPCQEALPYIDAMYKNYNLRDDVSFYVFYPIDSKEKLLKYVEAKKIRTPLIYNSYVNDKERLNLTSLFLFSMPRAMFLNKENKIVAFEEGFSRNFEVDVEKKLKSVMDLN